jgi:rhodanese-related sulfurtransferase
MPREINVKELSRLLGAGEKVVLVDVRQPWEHQTARLPDSVLIPLNELPQRAEEVEVPDGALVVTYCHHGVRSLTGAAILEARGVTNVVSLAGGIDAWSQHVDPAVARYLCDPPARTTAARSVRRSNGLSRVRRGSIA